MTTTTAETDRRPTLTDIVTCGICLDVMHPGTSAVLPCGHTFHRACVCEGSEEERLCPFCRCHYFPLCCPPNYVLDSLVEVVLPLPRKKHNTLPCPDGVQMQCFRRQTQTVFHDTICYHIQRVVPLVRRFILYAARCGRKTLFVTGAELAPSWWEQWRTKRPWSERVLPLLMRILCERLLLGGFQAIVLRRGRSPFRSGPTLYINWRHQRENEEWSIVVE